MIAIGVESKFRSIIRSLSGRGPKGEPNVPIASGIEVTDFLRRRHSCIVLLVCYEMLEF
jgi:hypothetical protein